MISLLASATRADITPSPGPILQGHYSHNASTAILAPLELRCLALSDGATQLILLSVDCFGLTRAATAEIRTAIHAATGVAPHHILVAASHTHCGPATTDLLGMPPDRPFLAAIERAALSSATAALASLRPATLGAGASSAHFGINRRPLAAIAGGAPPTTPAQPFSVNHGGLADPRVRMLLVADAASHAPLAVLFQYSCHPTTLSGALGLISPDYPGLARAAIENRLRCPALFLPGCCANVRPCTVDAATLQFRAGTQADLAAFAEQLASAVVRAVAATAPSPLTHPLSARQVELTLPFAPPPSSEQLATVLADTVPLSIDAKHPWARRVQDLVATSAFPTAESTSMQCLRIGPLTLVTIPGEPVQEIGIAIERAAAHTAAFASEVWAVGYANDAVGYLVTERHKLEGGYEPTAYMLYNRPAPFVEEERHIVAAALSLLRT